MNAIILSINPIHADNIFNGTKKYEFRKVRCKEDISKIIIYSTSPIMKVVGEAEVEKVLKQPPEALWKITSKQAGIDKEFFDEYYRNRSFAVAYELKNIKQYSEEKALSDYGLSFAPQSFAYVDLD
jgi:predicted transcriptional regulator